MAVALRGIAGIGLLTLLCGCTPPLVEQIHKTCANAPDVSACEDAEYAKAYAAERANLRKIGGTY